MNRWSRILLLGLAACSALLAADDDDPQPYQELFLTENVYAQEAREVQLTFFGVRRNHNAPSRGSAAYELEYGITDRIQVSLEWSEVRYSRASSAPERLAIGVKRSLPNVFGTSSHAAVGAEIKSDGMEPYLAVARDFRGRRIQVFGHLAAEWERPDGEEAGSRSLQGSVGFMAAWRHFRYVSEFSWDNGPSRSARFCPGLIVRMAGGREIGLGVPVLLSNVHPPSGSSMYGRTAVVMYLVQEFNPWRTR